MNTHLHLLAADRHFAASSGAAKASGPAASTSTRSGGARRIRSTASTPSRAASQADETVVAQTTSKPRALPRPVVRAALAAELGEAPADALAAFTALREWKNRF